MIVMTPEQAALITAVQDSKYQYRNLHDVHPNTVVLSHAQYMLLQQPTILSDMHVIVAYAPDASKEYPYCGWAEVATTTVETRSEMQVLFERDCAGMYNFFKLGNGEYLNIPTDNAFIAYKLGYAAGKVAK